MALGAEMKDVLRLVVRQGMSPVLIGLAIGLAATLAAGHLMAAQLYQISPHNPFLIVATTAVLAIAALLACLVLQAAPRVWIRSSLYTQNDGKTFKLTAIMNEFRFALRQLSKSPGFTVIAVMTLALGIGLNTSIFSLIDDLFLRSLPFKEPQRLLHLYSNARERNLLELAVSVPRFQHFRESQTIFDGFAAENPSAFTLTGLGEAVQILGGQVTSNYFDVLGVRPIRGRTFLPNEEEAADVAMVTENFWRKRMGADPDVIGRSITLGGMPHTIVGVLPNMPFSWVGPAAEVWTTKPFEIAGLSNERIMRGSGFLRVVGHLKPGITIEQARSAMPPLEQSYRARFPDKIDSASVITLKTLPDDVTGNLRPAFATLLAAVAFVLLIACSNVANLLLVRFTGRRREIALRMAIGASRASVVRLFLLESLFVSLLAGLAGAFLAWQIVPLVPRMAANFLPFDPDVRVQLSFRRTHVRDCCLRTDRPCHGHLSRSAKRARRSDQRVKARRPRHERQHKSTPVSEDPHWRAGGALGHAACGCGLAHHELHSAEPAKYRLSQ